MQRSVSSTARPRRLVAGLLVASALVAALATAWPARSVAGQGAAAPLDGVWRTFANGDRVNRVLRDGAVIWSATDGGGLVRWDTATGQYRQYLAPQDGLLSNDVHDLARTPDGRLWLATQRALAVLDPATGTVRNFTPDTSAGMPARVVTALAAAPDGTLWVGFAQEWDAQGVNPKTKAAGTFRPGGLARFDPAAGRWDEVQHAVLKQSGGLGEETPDEYVTIPSENVTVLEIGSDGILWIGTRPFFDLVARDCSPDEVGCQAGYAWVQSGGGLAARQGTSWQSWNPSTNELSCYSATVNDLAADKDGRMWVATGGRGLLLMKSGLRRSGCRGGAQPYYVMPVRDTPGPRGNYVWSVDVAPDGRVWIGHGRGREEGRGIGILDHNDTFDDSSAANQGQAWRFDDVWEFLNLDDGPEESTTVVSALDVRGPGPVLLGTHDVRIGDGAGLRLFDPGAHRWTPLRTADTGIPGNQITSVSWNEARGELWVSFSRRGVARWDGTSWRSWRAFGAGREVAKATLDVGRDKERIAVDMADQAAFDAAFPTTPRYVRLGTDPTLYRLTRSSLTTVGTSKYLDVTPKLQQALKKGTAVYNVVRGPASDAAAQVCFGADGTVWATGRETIWLGTACPSSWGAECWLDGGLGKFDGSTWTVFDQQVKDASGKTIPDQEVQSCVVDKQGRVWVGTGDAREAEGDGVAFLDPVTGNWTAWRQTRGVAFAGNGVADIDLDPVTGDLWLAHHAAQFCEPAPFGGSCALIRPGGGVSRWNGAKWDIWQKPAAPLAAIGSQGELSSVLVDRVAGRVWAGGLEAGAKNFHWGDGVGLNAVLNWCPLDCTNGAWQHKIWPEDGDVVALAQDADGHVWAGTHRYGNGLVPPVAGVKLYDGGDWFTLTPANSGLPSQEITALARAGEGMWVGTRQRGLAFYDGMPPPPTPTVPPATATPEEATPTSRPSAAATATGSATAPGPTQPTPRVRQAYLPFMLQPAWCVGCPKGTPPTPTPSPVTTATASPTPSHTPPPPTATPRPSNTPIPVPPTTTPTATAVPPTATATTTPTVTPTRGPGTWRQYTGQTFPRVRMLSVSGLADGSAVMVGEQGKGYRWDGEQWADLALPATRPLRRVMFATDKQGYIAADEGFLYETRNGGQSWRVVNTGSLLDDWWAVGVVSGADGLTGWLLGHARGTRLRLDGTLWAAPNPEDKNTGHQYTDVAVLGPGSAIATRGDATGARIMTWNGTTWTPATGTTGPLNDLHVPAADLGAAVGARGSVWRLGTGGAWAAMAPKPATLGQDLNAVHVRGTDDLWVAGARTLIFHWDGKAWTAHTVRVPQTPAIHSMWISPDGAQGWAVGDEGVVLRYE